MTLVVNNLTFAYGSNEIIHNINFTTDEGIISVIGPNGAGKSTLIKCLAGILSPNLGSASYKGNCLIQPCEKNGINISYMSQETPSISYMSVLEIMILGRLSELGFSVPKEVIELAYSTLESLGIENLAECNLNELSGGQSQMVMIAQCLVSDPDLLILDEPTNNLDLRKELELFEIITKITKTRGITTLMVLHDINFASMYSDKILVMKDGRVHSYGIPEDVITPDMIREVYGVEAIVSKNSNGKPKIEPIYHIDSTNMKNSMEKMNIKTEKG